MSNITENTEFLSLSRESMILNAERERLILMLTLKKAGVELGIEFSQPIVFDNGMFAFEVRDRFGNVIGSVESFGDVDSYDYGVVYYVFSSGNTRGTFEAVNTRLKVYGAEDAAANYAFEAIKAELF